MDINYEDVGLKVGIEIHQQLDTACKLFCNCKSRLSGKKPSAVLYRKLRPVLSEMGELDAAAKEEKERSKDFYYNIYREEACLVEMDEEPPHEVNRDALEIALKICLLLNAEIPDEIHFMRKIVIDGSNTSGFQRTAIVGMNGMLKLKDEKIGIANICLEEESCQIIRREQKKVVYGLDRLGIPLIEIGTRPEIKTPEQAKAVAEKIGMILRSTKNVKRGIGTIRQDINVSIKGGARVEIKGAQELGLIPKIIENEVARQLNLLKIRDDLRRIKFKPVKLKIFDVSDIFKNSQSLITRDKSTFAIKIERFAGFLKRKITPTRTLGNEIANYVRARTPLKGIIHSDEELGKYKLDKEFEKLASAVKAKKGDTLIIAVGEKNIVEKTMKVIVERINQLLVGVPEETRRALDNGDTEYMRPLPGAARMYPETDVPPIRIDKELINKLNNELPELIEDKIKRFIKEYGLNPELSKQIAKSKYSDMFESLIGTGAEAKVIASTLLITLKELEKEGVKVKNIKNWHLESIFKAFARGEIPRTAIPQILKGFAKKPKSSLEQVMQEAKIEKLTMEDLDGIIEKIVKENAQLAEDKRGKKILMGLIMQKVRGRIDGMVVMERLEKKLEERRK